MKTGKFIVGFVFIVFMAVSTSGCSILGYAIRSIPHKIAIDPDLPEEEAAVVMFHSAIFVREYNGIDVSEWYPRNKTKNITATIPAGETHLLFDLYAGFDRRYTTYTLTPKNVKLKFNFEAGKEYTVSIYASKNEGNFISPKQKVILAVWDRIYIDANPGNRHEDSIIKSWELGEF